MSLILKTLFTKQQSANSYQQPIIMQDLLQSKR